VDSRATDDDYDELFCIVVVVCRWKKRKKLVNVMPSE
jgi:hypothetical protein